MVGTCALSLETAGITPVVVITKTDLTDQPEEFGQAAASLLLGLNVVVVDARIPEQVERLSPRCGQGQTVAFVGSSGVGKSTPNVRVVIIAVAQSYRNLMIMHSKLFKSVFIV